MDLLDRSAKSGDGIKIDSYRKILNDYPDFPFPIPRFLFSSRG